jgi:tetratricopeptide (TPR) repeat protein
MAQRTDPKLAELEERARSCRRHGDLPGAAVALGWSAVLLRRRGDPGGAMQHLAEQEEICQQLGEPRELAACLGNQALVYMDWDDLDAASKLIERVQGLYEQAGDRVGVQTALGNRAVILRRQGQLDQAMELLRRQEDICRRIHNERGLAVALGNQGLILGDQGHHDDALRLLQQEEQLCRRLGDRRGVARSLANQAGVVLQANRDPDAAIRMLDEAEQIFRQADDPGGLALALAKHAAAFAAHGRTSEARSLAEQARHIAADHDLEHVTRQIEPLLSAVGLQANAGTERAAEQAGLCWHCKTRPADPGRSRESTLHKGSAERAVPVPVCAHCAAVLRRKAIWTNTIVWPGLLGGIALAVVAAHASAMLWIAAIGLWAATIAGAVAVNRAIDHHAGYHNPDPSRVVPGGMGPLP